MLVNLWATWCAPCLKEMPSLNRLQQSLGGDQFEVVAISIDRGNGDKPKAFLKKIKADALGFFHDPKAKVNATLKGLTACRRPCCSTPKVWKSAAWSGPAEWDSEEAKALLKAAIEAVAQG